MIQKEKAGVVFCVARLFLHRQREHLSDAESRASDADEHSYHLWDRGRCQATYTIPFNSGNNPLYSVFVSRGCCLKKKKKVATNVKT